jgi:hypothetical protein
VIEDKLAELATVTLLCNGLGAALKRVPKIPKWSIPFILAMAGASSAAWRGDCNPESVILGAACGLLAVGGHQAWKRGMAALRNDNDT